MSKRIWWSRTSPIIARLSAICWPQPTMRLRKPKTANRRSAIAKQRPDLILTDIQLPIMDGYEATRRIKADASLRSIPIIAVTSYALSSEGQKARAAGCDDYLPKPYSPRELLSKIRQYLQ